MFTKEKILTKEEHQENLKNIRNFLIKAYPEYSIKIENIEFFFETEIRFVLEAPYKK